MASRPSWSTVPNGIPLVMVDDVATAVEMLTGHGLGIVTVH